MENVSKNKDFKIMKNEQKLEVKDFKIFEFTDSNINSLKKLADEALLDGDFFIQKTIDEWISGKNTFSKPGEKFFGLEIADELAGCGGLNQDPFIEDKTIGRVRHVYIAKKFRGLGLSKVLMKLIMDKAKNNFSSLRLSTHNPIAASLYESLGFEKEEGYKATHIIKNLRK